MLSWLSGRVHSSRNCVKVLLEYKVDPSLLSGICVNIGDKYIDLSAGHVSARSTSAVSLAPLCHVSRCATSA